MFVRTEIEKWTWSVQQDGPHQVFVTAYNGVPNDLRDANFAGPVAYGATVEEAILIALTDAGIHFDDAFELAGMASWVYLGPHS